MQIRSTSSHRTRRRRSALWSAGVFMAVATLGGKAVADDADVQRDDWTSVRSRWERHGVSVRGDYVSETFRVASGGLRQGTRYAQQLRAGVDIDMHKAAGWEQGTFHVTLNDRAGRGATTDLAGNRMPIQEVYSSQFLKLTELSYDQDIASHHANVKLGLWAMGNDFGGLPILCELVNAAFCAHPLAMSSGSGWGNYPNARLGVRVNWHLAPTADLRIGAFQVNPAYSSEDHGFSLHPRGTTGAMFPVELDLHARDPNAARASELKLGAYYDNSHVDRQGDAGHQASGRYGYYALGTQRVYQSRSDPRRGLVLAGEVMKTDPRTAQMSGWYSVDAIWQGTFASRAQDTIAVGYVRAVINPSITRAWRDSRTDSVHDAFLDTLPDAESVVELSYGWRVNHAFLVRPDVQYVMDPGAFSQRRTKNVLAFGLQLKATL
ncbi:carbohydrate porin [Bacillus sp. NP157]|nr:carbohydrate porin [Bacillus sp. NP157]